MARLGIAGLGPTCEVKVEVCGWEGKQQHLIYQRSRPEQVSTRTQAALRNASHLPCGTTRPRGHDHIPASILRGRVRQALIPRRGGTLTDLLQPALGAASTCPSLLQLCSSPKKMAQPAFPLPSTRRSLREPARALGF